MIRLSLLFSLLLLPSSLMAQTIYMKPSEALKVIFKDSQEVVSERKTLSAEQIKTLSKQLGATALKPEWNFYVAKTRGKVDGYALIDNEVGKTEPITFMTAITPEGQVQEVEVLVYREPFGSEVHEKMFLKQYREKGLISPLKVGQDIQNISGATMSSQAITRGVKRDLAVWNEFYGKP